MRSLILRATLLTEDADLGAPPPEVQASAPPPVDNDHVAQGCEQFGDAHSPAPVQAKPLITPARIVMVRDHHGRAAPAIVVTVHEDGTIAASVFRADHAVHAAEGLDQVDPEGTARGWFWPQRI